MHNYIKDFSIWKLNEQSNQNMTIPGRESYIYRPNKDNKFWEYQKKGTSSWNLVENESSVSALNSKYNKQLAIHKPDSFTEFNIEGRESYNYKISSNLKNWEYQKKGTSTWSGVSNSSTVSKLNKKYGRSLKPYSEYELIHDGWEDRAKLAANLLLKKGKSIGLTKEHAAAFIGNFKQESGVRANNSQAEVKGMKLGLGFKPITLEQAKNTGEWAGYGLAHWTADRRSKLIEGGHDTISKQLDFVIKELKGSYAGAWKKIKSAKTVSSATDAVVKYYEKAGKPAGSKRKKAAYDTAKLLGWNVK